MVFPATEEMSPRPEEPRARFLVELARALGTYGTSAPRIEDVISHCAEAFGFYAQTFTTPTSVFVSIEDDGGDLLTYLARVFPGETDLSKMMALDRVFNRTITGELSPSQGVAEIKRIVAQPPLYPSWMIVLCFGVTGACAGNFLGGAHREIQASAIVGLLIGLLVLFAGKGREFVRLVEFLSGFGAALVASALAVPFGGYVTNIPIIAGVIILLPGLTLTIAMVELAMKHVVSGTARLAGAVMVLLVMGFGVLLGQRVALLVFGDTPVVTAPDMPWYADLASVFVATVCLAVLFQAHLRHAWVMIVAGLMSFYTARYGTMLFGPEVGVLGASVCVGVCSNLYARLFDRPAQVMMLPGLIILVPGSLGLKSLQLFMSDATVDAVQSSFTVLVIGVALVVGLLLANVVVAPRKVL